MLALFVESAAASTALLRPLVIAVVAVLAFASGLWLVLRNRYQAAFYAALLFLTLIAPLAALLLVAAALIPLVASSIRHRRMSTINWATLSDRLNAVALLLLMLGLASAVSAGALHGPWPPAAQRGVPSSVDAPDVFLLMLDGYPRADTLQRDFSFDNTPFLDNMRKLGFDIGDRSHSNYNLTALTLASMFNADHVDDMLNDPPTAPAAQYRAMTELINDGAVLRRARELGYSITSIPSPFSVVALSSADRVLDSGEVTEFELDLLQEGLLPKILPEQQADLLLSQHRSRIQGTFNRVAELAAEVHERPRLVFAHVMSPHPPAAFTTEGAPLDGWGCFPEACTMWDGGQFASPSLVRDRTTGQIAYINQLVVETVRSVLANSDRAPVIIIFSDHGHRLAFEDREESLRNLMLAYTPGMQGLVPDDASPINILPRILNAYADAGIPLATEESYWTPSWLTRVQGFFPLTLVNP